MMNQFAKSFIQNQSGATAIEYGLIVALIATAAIVAMGTLGSSVNNSFSNSANALQ